MANQAQKKKEQLKTVDNYEIAIKIMQARRKHQNAFPS
jgi:hypothetical protein